MSRAGVVPLLLGLLVGCTDGNPAEEPGPVGATSPPGPPAGWVVVASNEPSAAEGLQLFAGGRARWPLTDS
jgi:hypothetical protein